MMDKASLKPKILIVDDLPENIIALEILVKKMGAEVYSATSGHEALALTLYHDFSLILLDVMMPEMNGYEVAELLKKDDRTAEIPIIFITAMDKSDAQELKAYGKGAVDFIYKPINEIMLSSKIKIYLDLYRLQHYVETVLHEQKAGKAKILIVDDIPANLLALSQILKKLDAEIIEAGSGNEALTSCLYDDFALIILDVQMPEMNGYEVAEILKSDERTENIPIIFVTAIDRDSAKEIKGYGTGAVDFIFKPFNEFILISKVRIFLEMYQIKHGLEQLVLERTRELEIQNEKLKKQIEKNGRTTAELENARSYLASMFNSIKSSMISVDSNANIVDLNTDAHRISGVSSQESQGKPIGTVFPWFSDLSADVMKAMETGQPVAKNRIKVQIGNHLTVNDFSVFPLDNKGGQGAVIRIDDVTERARIDEMMIQNEKMLSIGGLAAGMAHEINNPLAGIIQSIQVMKNRMRKDTFINRSVAEECGTTFEMLKTYMEKRDVFQMMDGIVGCGQRAAQIVENILSFSHKSEGQTTREDINKLLDSTIELAGNEYNLKKSFDFRKIEIQRQYAPDLPLVACQKSKIQQTMLNLLTNGAHALAENRDIEGKTSRFRLSTKSEKDMVCFEIEDNGPGLPENIRKRIFEPFFTTKQSGTGLGLSISYFIITEEHKGTMEVESSPGKGTKFLIRLPINTNNSL